MNHPESWYHELATKLGHPGYVDLAEIRQAEARESRETAASVKWKHHPGGPYYTEAGDSIYVIHRNGRKWRIEAGPAALPRYTRFQDGIATLADAKNLALNMPCFRCGLGSPLVLMTPCLPARSSLASDPGERWRCIDTETCEAERARLTDRPVPVLNLAAPHKAVITPDGDGYLVTCPLGCNLGDSAHALTSLAAERRVELHRHATRPLVPASSGPACRNSLVKHLGDRL